MDMKQVMEVGVGWTGRLGLTNIHYWSFVYNRKLLRTYCIAQGTLPSALWRPKWEGNSKKGIYVYLRLIHFAPQQKLTQHCKATMPACSVAQSCLTLCNPTECSPPGSSVHGILQERILHWVAISLSRGSSLPRNWTWISCIGRQILYHWANTPKKKKKSKIINPSMNHYC